MAKQCTNQLREELRPKVSGTQKFLKKPEQLEVTRKALWNGDIYRHKTAMPVDLPKAMEAISWTTSATHHLLIFLYYVLRI